jgi:hypothetical protein
LPLMSVTVPYLVYPPIDINNIVLWDFSGTIMIIILSQVQVREYMFMIISDFAIDI